MQPVMQPVVKVETRQSLTGRTRVVLTLACGHQDSITLPKRYSPASRDKAMSAKRRKCGACTS